MAGFEPHPPRADSRHKVDLKSERFDFYVGSQADLHIAYASQYRPFTVVESTGADSFVKNRAVVDDIAKERLKDACDQTKPDENPCLVIPLEDERDGENEVTEEERNRVLTGRVIDSDKPYEIFEQAGVVHYAHGWQAQGQTGPDVSPVRFCQT